jgi:hypothetical protein
VAEEAVLGQAHDHAVVEEKAVLVAHQPVAALAHGQRGHHAGVEEVEELARVGALHEDLAEGGGVEQADVLAGVEDLARHRGMDRLAGCAEAVGAAPVGDRFPMRAVGLVPAVHRGPADGLEERAARLAGERAEGDGGVGRAEGGGADLRDRRVQRIGQHREAVDVRQLPLVGRHAERGVALGVLDALVALLRGEAHVGDLHVVLVVEEGLRPQVRTRALRHRPDRQERLLGFVGGGRRGGVGGGMAGFRGGAVPGGMGVGEDRARVAGAGGGARGDHEAGAVMAERRPFGVGRELGAVGVPGQLAAAMRPEMHHRGPAAGHGDGVAGDLLQGRALARLQAGGDAGDAAAALHGGDGRGPRARGCRGRAPPRAAGPSPAGRASSTAGTSRPASASISAVR